MQKAPKLRKKVRVPTSENSLENRTKIFSIRKLQFFKIYTPVAVKIAPDKISKKPYRYRGQCKGFALFLGKTVFFEIGEHLLAPKLEAIKC